jgi:hypothetical protein
MKSSKKINRKLIADVISDIERYDAAVKRNLKSPIKDDLAIKQFQDLRDNSVKTLLDYLVENVNKDLLKQYVQNLDVPVAA